MRVPPHRYVPSFVPDPDRLLASVCEETSWRTTMRARSTASFGQPYNYSGQQYDAVPMPPAIAGLAARCAEVAGHPYNNCLLNRYATGDNTMGFHQDLYDELVASSEIAIVSLGAARPLVFRHVETRALHQVTLEHGSLLLMNRATQEHWLHAVPRSPHAGLRISATFRQLATAAI